MNRHSLRPWVACFLIAASGVALLAAQSDSASGPPGPPAGATNLSLSASGLGQRARWQERLTLGPGDTLNLSLFEMPDTVQNDVLVGPDGRITFLQARDVMASGLTIDELRSKLDEALARYYQNPRTIITPAAFRSKKYFVLGAVPNRGVFPLDRPLTVIEALARAGGLETGLYERNAVELADLQHSFLARDGRRMPVDFERLFQRGDLSQNVALEPNDYLYFALATANEIYVLGEVSSPGVAAFLPRSTAISAISARGGFTTRAYRQRVLVVRGSFPNPQTFIVDAAAILAGKAPDFRLQSKDLVYVHLSPWVKAEEILDTAATAFIQGVVVGTAGREVRPIFTQPFIKGKI
jgi:protein involved in polysaccharide export with SLBB domain